MKKISSIAELKQEILMLEIKKAKEESLLREQFKHTYESLKPMNLIKSSVSKLIGTSGIKSELVNTSLGMTSGFLVKKLLVGGSLNPVKNIMGTLLQIGVSSLVSNKPNLVKSIGNFFFKGSESKPDLDND